MSEFLRDFARRFAELDAGKALDGQIHLVAAMQRLNDVEERLGALEERARLNGLTAERVDSAELRRRLDQAVAVTRRLRLPEASGE